MNNSELNFDLAEFEAELKAGKYDHLIPAKVKKQKKAQLKLVTKPKPHPKHNSTAHELLNSIPEQVTEIPKAVAIVSQELEIHCSFCSCVHTFITTRSVRRQYKNGRSSFAAITETVEKEIAALPQALPTEKMLTKMSVLDCDNCREAEDF